MRHKFLDLTVEKMVKIGVHLRQVTAKLTPGYRFLNHSRDMKNIININREYWNKWY